MTAGSTETRNTGCVQIIWRTSGIIVASILGLSALTLEFVWQASGGYTGQC
jgi:hypothetical protein